MRRLKRQEEDDDDDEEEQANSEASDPAVRFVLDESCGDIPQIATRVNALIAALLSEPPQQQQQQQPSSQQQQQQQPSLSAASDGELPALLNRIDPSVQRAAAAEIVRRLTSANPAQKAGVAAALTAGPAPLRALADALLAPGDAQLHVLALKALFAVADSHGDALRRIGAIRALTDVLAHTSDSGRAAAMLVLARLCPDAQNRAVMVRAGTHKALLAFCSSAAAVDGVPPVLCATALRTLAALTDGCVRSQEAVVKDGGLSVVVALVLGADVDPRVHAAAVALLCNLANCASFKAGVPREAVVGLLQLLRLTEVYPETRFIYDAKDAEAKARLTAATATQCSVLDVLHAIAKLEANKEAIGPAGVRILVRYITPHSGLAYDVFPWSMEIEQRVLALLSLLLTDAQNKHAFLEAKGMSQLLSVLRLPEVFPEHVEALCASIITGPLEKEMRSLDGLDTILISLFKYLPGNASLQNTLVDSLNALAATEAGSQRIFEEGGVHALFKLLLSENNGIRIRALSTVAAISRFKFIRRVMRLLDPQVATIAASAKPLLSDERSHEALSEILRNLTNTEEAKEMLGNQAALKAILGMLGALCVSPKISARQQSIGTFLLLVGNIGKPGTTLMLASSAGALAPILKAMASSDIEVQQDAMMMATELCSVANARQALEAADFVSRLKDAGRTHNVCKKGSKLVEVVSGLVAAWKRAPGESPKAEYEVLLDPGDGAPLKLPITPATVELSYIEEHAYTLLGASKRDNVVMSLQLADKPGEAVIPRDSEQLRRLLAVDVKAGRRFSTFRVYIRQASRRTLMPAKHSPLEDLAGLTESDLKRLVVALCERLRMPIKDAVALLSTQQQHPAPTVRTAAAKNPAGGTPQQPTESSDIFGSMLSELRGKASLGLAFLNHVDADAEQKRRAKESDATSKAGLLRDIARHPQEHAASKRLISQEVAAGRELWTRSTKAWIAEVGEAVMGNSGALLRAVLHLCTMAETRAPFEEVLSRLLKPVAPRLVAKQLNRIGFAIGQATFSSAGDDALNTEYLTVLRPQRLPVKQLLRILEWKLAEAI